MEKKKEKIHIKIVWHQKEMLKYVHVHLMRYQFDK